MPEMPPSEDQTPETAVAPENSGEAVDATDSEHPEGVEDGQVQLAQ